MIEFTELLDEYLAATQAVKKERENYSGYSFGYHFSEELYRENQARTALNEAFNTLTKKE